MQQKDDKNDLEADTIRFKILPLFSTTVDLHRLPLSAIEIILQTIMFIQILKFPVDYFSINWFGYNKAVFWYFDISYYIQNMSVNGYQSVLIFTLTMITLYWMVCITLFLTKYKASETIANVRRLILLFVSTIFYLPILNIILTLFNCGKSSFFRTCVMENNIELIVLSLITFIVFAIFITVQSSIRFQFIQDDKMFKRLKSSSFISAGLIIYSTVNQISFYFLDGMISLLIMDLTMGLLLIIFILKDQHTQEWTKLLELNMLAINLIPILIANLMYFMKFQLNFSILLILWPIAIVTFQKMNLHTLQFQLDNINKWNTPSMMIRYSDTLRKLLKRSNQHYFEIMVHGYMEVHKQKCDNPTCPYNAVINKSENQLFRNQSPQNKIEEITRTQGIIKKIFNDGCKIAPVNAQLQLEYAQFLYDINQKEVSLKNLLLIKYSELPFYKYYKYVTLKDRIHNQMCQKPQKQFLDLVSELQVKRKEEQIIQKFEQAALINLQFWSVLNEDHPDFQKLNQIGSSRVKIGLQVRQRYQQICQFAHSQKITNLYVHFMTSIQNNQDIFNKVYDQIKRKYNLDEKIVLQDWSNSSISTLLVSIQQANHGSIIDLNSTCASMFGYEKYEVVNRHFKTMFSQELRDQIKQFLNPRIKQQFFFMSHKNSYLLKIKRKIQTYNSMDTGMTSICTLNNQINLNSCFIIFNKKEKVVGISPSCISLLGIQLKMLQNQMRLQNIFKLSLEDIRKVSANGGQSFELKQILKIVHQNTGDSSNNDPCSIKLQQFSNGIFEIELTINRIRVLSKGINYQPKKFQFQIQATLSDFKYIGIPQNQQLPFLSQFSQLQFAQSLKPNNNMDENYGQNFQTLRLVNNIVQVIEDNDDQLSEANIRKDAQAQLLQTQNIARKDQNSIFQSKASFQTFIQDYKITYCIRFLLLLGVMIAIGCYIAFYFIYKGHNDNTTPYFQEVAYQNLIIGAIAKDYALITTLELMKAKVSNRIPTSYYATYMTNLNYLQSIKLLGSQPAKVTTYLSATQTRVFYSDQFLLSFINYAFGMVENMQNCTTQPTLVEAYNEVDSYKVDYLKLNGKYTRQQMYEQLQVRQKQIVKIIQSDINSEIIMFICGMLILVILGVLLGLIISKINDQKINTLMIFLGITEQQIQKFSSKTQKFLISLHVQDATGQVEVDDQNQVKKTNHSMFAKKKRFKLVKLSKSIYLKILLIPLIGQIYFIQSFLQSYSNLVFMKNSIPYIALTSQADNTFYSAIGKIQTAILNKGTNETGLTSQYLQYYRQYFDTHYSTFGHIQSFHEQFTSVFMKDICNRSVPIGAACSIPLLASNGSLLIFTDITVRTQKSDFSTDFTNDYYVEFAVLSATHKYLTLLAMKVQTQLISTLDSNLLNALLVWIFVMIGISLIYGMLVLNKFIEQINLNKNMIMLLPISIARALPQVKRYINNILQASRFN